MNFMPPMLNSSDAGVVCIWHVERLLVVKKHHSMLALLVLYHSSSTLYQPLLNLILNYDS